jgi:hypothetical protein
LLKHRASLFVGGELVRHEIARGLLASGHVRGRLITIVIFMILYHIVFLMHRCGHIVCVMLAMMCMYIFLMRSFL